MSDINLLPEDLRKREQAARQELSSSKSAPEFSQPKAKNKAPVEGAPPGRWQQLMSALKKNMNNPTEASVSQSIVSPPQPTKPAVQNNKAVIIGPSTIRPVEPPASPPSPPVQPLIPKTKTYDKPKSTGGQAFNGSPPSILDVNLLPDQEGKKISGRTIAGLVSLVLSVALAVVLVYFSLKIYVDGKIEANNKVQEEVIELQQKLETSRLEAEQALTTQRRVQILAGIIKQRSQWKNFFTWLEKNTIPLVQFNSLAADVNGSITVIGQAPNFTEVGRQMLAFKESKEVLDVSLSEVTVDLSQSSSGLPVTVINFTFTIKLPPSLFVINN